MRIFKDLCPYLFKICASIPQDPQGQNKDLSKILRILLKILLPKTFMLLKEIFCDKITTLLEIVEISQNN